MSVALAMEVAKLIRAVNAVVDDRDALKAENDELHTEVVHLRAERRRLIGKVFRHGRY